MRLAGQTILVTGASGGIGSAIVSRLRDDGAHVVASDLAGAGIIACDVTIRAEVDALLNQCPELDGVVHAAALCGGSGPFWDLAQDDLERYLATNVVGCFNVMQASARHMIRSQTPGRIVVIGSINAIAAEPHAAPYVASKGAVRMLVKAAAVDLAVHGIAANLVHPGPITVDRNRDAFAQPETVDQFARHLPMRSPGGPESVAAAAAYLFDPSATFTTGAEITVDGGLLAAAWPSD